MGSTELTCLATVLILLGSGCAPSEGERVVDRGADAAGANRVLRVCADPNNLPFSNAARQGFENKLAELVAKELGARIEYTWWAQRRGFIRNTLTAHTCDVVMGLPTSMELALTTRPYYRSTYVFVTRRDDKHDIRSLDDPLLRELRVGVQVIGDDYNDAPPAHAMSRRGIVKNVTGYSVYGDYAEEAPPSRIVRAVAEGEVDVAIAWGAMAGYYATRQRVPLTVVPVSPQVDLPFMPMVFDISLGVRREDIALRDELDAVLARRRVQIDALLDAFHVPRASRTAAARSAENVRPVAPAQPQQSAQGDR